MDGRLKHGLTVRNAINHRNYGNTCIEIGRKGMVEQNGCKGIGSLVSFDYLIAVPPSSTGQHILY